MADPMLVGPASGPDSAVDLGMEYTGRDNLDVMRAAFHYNSLLYGWIRGAAEGCERIVDFGAGAGAFAIPLAAEGFQVLCVEVDRHFQLLLSREGLPVVDDLSAVPDNSLDLIYAFDVLEHIRADGDMLETWCGKLKPGGNLLVYVPAFDILYSSMDKRIGHCRRYRKEDARAKLEAAGFGVDAWEYVDCLGFFASLLYKLTNDGAGTISWRPVRLYDRYVFRMSRMVDRMTHRWVGKNLLLRAHKPAS
jgi:SAM-dependent methyltransferase